MGIIHLPKENGLRCYLAEPSSPGPGVVVLHAWWGLVADVVGVCDTLAENGFIAVAPDLHRGRVANTPEEAESLMQEITWATRVEMTAATVRWLRKQSNLVPSRVALLGFSMGGATAMIAAAKGIGDAVVTFYGTDQLEGHIPGPKANDCRQGRLCQDSGNRNDSRDQRSKFSCGHERS